MNKTSIEWTDRTWNPIRARLKGDISHKARSGTFCTRISPGCTHCYASTINKRFGNGLEYTVPNLERVEFYLSDKILAEPLKLKKPSRIFVGDMFDLFHEAIPQELIAEVLRVALKTPRHTFQFLTKRAERMQRLVNAAQEHWGVKFGEHMWFGVSVEDQPRADERILFLLRTTAALRFLSVEPLLEAVNIHLPDAACNHPSMDGLKSVPGDLALWNCSLCDGYVLHENHPTKPNFVHQVPGISWVICGGESGPGARHFNLGWAESLLNQCRAADVPFFLKQIGKYPLGDVGLTPHVPMEDGKGGDPADWPEKLRVREFPTGKA